MPRQGHHRARVRALLCPREAQGAHKSEPTRKPEAQISIFQRYESQASHLDFANKRYTTLKWQANVYWTFAYQEVKGVKEVKEWVHLKKSEHYQSESKIVKRNQKQALKSCKSHAEWQFLSFVVLYCKHFEVPFCFYGTFSRWLNNINFSTIPIVRG